MAKEWFDVCLTGNLLTGHNRREVSVNLAQLVGTSIPQAERLLDAALCVKVQVDESTAAYYQEIVEETGAEAVIRACLAQSDQHARVDADAEEPRFDLPATIPEPPPAAPAVSPVPIRLQPEQGIDEESTPPLLELALLEVPEPDEQDITQPLAPPPPAPFARRRKRWPLLVATVAGIVAAGTAVAWLLPAPVEPGQAIPRVGESLNLAQPFQQQVEQFWRAQSRLPRSPQDLQWQGPQALGDLGTLTLGANGTLELTYDENEGVLAGQTLILEPFKGDQGFQWTCAGGTLSALERPLECRQRAIQP